MISHISSPKCLHIPIHISDTPIFAYPYHTYPFFRNTVQGLHLRVWGWISQNKRCSGKYPVRAQLWCKSMRNWCGYMLGKFQLQRPMHRVWMYLQQWVQQRRRFFSLGFLLYSISARGKLFYIIFRPMKLGEYFFTMKFLYNEIC